MYASFALTGPGHKTDLIINKVLKDYPTNIHFDIKEKSPHPNTVKFIGYKNNTMNKHQHNLDKDGRETNPIITSILHVKTCAPNETLENEYIRYCNSLDIKPYKYKRKYWIK